MPEGVIFVVLFEFRQILEQETEPGYFIARGFGGELGKERIHQQLGVQVDAAARRKHGARMHGAALDSAVKAPCHIAEVDRFNALFAALLGIQHSRSHDGGSARGEALRLALGGKFGGYLLLGGGYLI